MDKELTRVELQIKVNKQDHKEYERTMAVFRKSNKAFREAIEYLKSDDMAYMQEQWNEYLEEVPKIEQRLVEQVPAEHKEQLRQNRQTLDSLNQQYQSISTSILLLGEKDKKLGDELTLKQKQLSVEQVDERHVLRTSIKQLKVRQGFIIRRTRSTPWPSRSA